MMSFDTSFNRLIGNEGGYVNDPKRIEASLRRALYEESRRNATAVYAPVNSRAYDCAIKGCFNKAYAKGLCNAHYIRQRNGVDMSLPVRNRKRGVGCIECGKVCDAKGGWMRCRTHFKVHRARTIKRAAIASLGGRCERCNETHPAPVFDFHHAGAKDIAISEAFSARSIATIAAELAKCRLLCANCHRVEHHGDI